MGRNSNDIATIDWRGYTGNKAVFPVCMRSPAVRGRCLTAQMKAAAEHVAHLVLLVCDSLDRHNIKNIEHPKQAALDLAQTWLEGNLERVTPYFKSVTVLGWEADIRSHPLFTRRVAQLSELRKMSPHYRDLVHTLSTYYLNSKRNRFEADQRRGLATWFDSQEAYESSRDYLEEEFAGNMVCHAITGGLPFIYHGLCIDDYQFFARSSSSEALTYPVFLPVNSKRLGPSTPASSLFEGTQQVA